MAEPPGSAGGMGGTRRSGRPSVSRSSTGRRGAGRREPAAASAGATSRKDAGIEPFQWSQVIADVEGLRTFPRMTGAFDPAAVVRTFKGLRDRILDRLRP